MQTTLDILGRRVALPAGWTISSLFYAQGQLTANLMVAAHEPAVARITPSGDVQRIPDLGQITDLTADGRYLLVIDHPPPASQTSGEPTFPRVLIYDTTAGGRVTASTPSQYAPVHFLGGKLDSVLVTNTVAPEDVYRVWNPLDGSLAPVPGPKHLPPLVLDRTSGLWVTFDPAGHELAAYRSGGEQVWSVTVPNFKDIALAKNGGRLVVATADALRLLDLATGAEIASTPTPATGYWRIEAWESAVQLLVRDEEHDNMLARCDVQTATCVPLQADVNAVGVAFTR